MSPRKADQEDACFVCGRVGANFDWFVLLEGRVTRLHCSSSCISESVDQQRSVAAAKRRRRVVAAVGLVVLVVGANTVRRHFPPQPEWISGGPAAEPLPVEEPVVLGQPRYGPAWPPTDAEWKALFARSHWVYPLPGPVRRHFTPDGRIFGPAVAAGGHPALCRLEGRCGVDLGGTLWGEHVYAAQDGVVDRVQAGGHDEHGGQYVRIAHFGGMVFTQYFHLAAIPRGIARGAHVRAGELVGLLGDTGTEGGGRHLYFSLSIRPSKDFPEAYWDPSPWMSNWPLRVPPNGTVAGLVPTARPGDMPRRHH